MQARAGGDLLFHWERPRRRQLAIAGFLLLSAALHAFGFYIFQVVYPPPIALLPPPAQVTVIAPTSPEARTFLNWLNAEDPALASQTQRPADARVDQLPKLAHVPSYVAVKPQLKGYPEPQPLPSPPQAFPPEPVQATQAAPEAPRLNAPTTLFFSHPGLVLQSRPAGFNFHVSTREPPENVRFIIAINSSGMIRYIFPEHTSGDADLDEQAHRYLVGCRFDRLPAVLPGDGLIWTTATFEFGNDLQLPASSTETAP